MNEEYDLYSVPRQGVVRVHGAAHCAGSTCCIHNPSDHHMNSWPMVFRFDKFDLAERTCPHGIGHPDPDSLRYLNTMLAPDAEAYALSVHSCCGCCRIPEEES